MCQDQERLDQLFRFHDRLDLHQVLRNAGAGVEGRDVHLHRGHGEVGRVRFAARRARQKLSATTATASSSFTTFLTPGMDSAGVVSTDCSVPPNTGAIATAA